MTAETDIAAIADSGATTAAEARAALTSVLARADKNGAHVYQSTLQSIPASTWTAVTYDTETFDDNSYHSTVTNPSRLTAPADGLYLVGGGNRLDNTTARVINRLAVNGVDVAPQAETHGSGFLGDTNVVLLALSAGDYVEAQIYHNSSGARNTLPEGCGFWIVQLRG